MKQYVSVFMMTLTSVRKKLILILAVMTTAECLLFALNCRSSLWMEMVIDAARLEWIAALAFAALTAVLLSGKGSVRQDYTLLRLSLTDRQVFHCRALCFALCYLLLWALQLLLALVFCKIFADLHQDLPGFGEQTAYLALYRHPFLHSLLPMEELTRWMRNLLLLAGLSLTASNSARKPAGFLSWSTLILAAVTIVTFSFLMGSSTSDWIISIAALCLILNVYTSGEWRKDTDREIPLKEEDIPSWYLEEEVEPCEEI